MFKGFRVKPENEGLSFMMADGDKPFSGKTDRFEFVVVAADQEEADSFAKEALGAIPYQWA